MFGLIIAMLLAPGSQGPALELAEPTWAFIVPAHAEREPSPPVDTFLAELDQDYTTALGPFAPDQGADPFDVAPPEPATEQEILEGEAAAALSAFEATVSGLGVQ